ncbi:substrate-binding periplasmic protein [Chitinimonas prasina]|uniref:substrate-binding periplasmic protein n=1 Tax=Chitinimonas prasina TaxID=1434937 RepID=UPI0024E07761|nr:hypothetical protein [Chitinimonas prasina]
MFAVHRILATCLLVLFAMSSLAANELRLGRSDQPSELTDRAEAVLRVAYQRLGVTPRFEPYPLRRSLALAAKGELDGDTMRVAELAHEIPSLVRVAVPVVSLSVVAYGHDSCPNQISWAQLLAKRLVHERGVLVLERRTRQVAVLNSSGNDDALRMVSEGLADYAVGVGVELDAARERHPRYLLCRVSTPVEEVPLYHYLHKRHRGLAARLTGVLEDMQRKGELAISPAP